MNRKDQTGNIGSTKHLRWFVVLTIFLGVVLVLLVPIGLAGEIPQAADAPKPLTPEESRKRFRLPDDLAIELAASEPLIAEPAAIAFDESGRLFVGELHGYNLDGYLDIVELNKSGVLDRQVRRIRRASPQAEAAAKKATYGTIKLLIDKDGDGRMDQALVWADRLPPVYGMVPARGGLIVTCPPDILYLADRDGDGHAEVREKLFSGFTLEVMDRGVNNPRWGLDNWIYTAWWARGDSGITGMRLAKPVRIAHTDFRFRSDGAALEPITGTNGTFGQAFTDFGDRFLTNTGNPALYAVPLPYRYLARNPYVAVPETIANASNYHQVYPTSQPDPWRQARGKDPAWVKFYGRMEATPNGYFTSACGQMVYRAELLPKAYRGNLFCCEPAQNLVHRCLLAREGAGFRARRARGEERSEFLTSTDQWFRPVNLTTGPDGAIYLVDMYREIIEDYSAIPRFLQQQYVKSLINGRDRGRIWRIAPKGAARPAPVDFRRAAAAELVEELSSGNAWRRETAQRLLVERGDRSAAKSLQALVHKGSVPQARLHALYTLDGLGMLQPAEVEQGLDDPSYGVRLHALRLAERWLNTCRSLQDKVLGMIGDPDPSVRLQLALTLGEVRDERALAALAQLAAEHGQERWLSAAILSSVPDSADALLTRLLGAPSRAGSRRLKPAATTGALALLRPLAATVGARRQEASLIRLLETIAEIPPTQATMQTALLDGLLEGLGRSASLALRAEAGQRALERLFASPSPEVRQRTLRAAGMLQLTQSPVLVRAWTAAGRQALDSQRPVAERLAAVRLLHAAPWAQRAALKPLLDARQSPELQLAVVEVLASRDEAGVSEALLANWNSLSPKVQDQVLNALLARRSHLPKLLESIAKRMVLPSSLSAFQRARLLENSDPAIRRQAQKLLADRSSEDRAAVLKRYQSALTLRRNVQRGQQLFEQHCAQCHRLNDQGFDVGPDLAGVRDRPDATLLADLLDPSSILTPGYALYTVTLQDGRVFTGVLAAETATSITLRREKGQTEAILRKNIEEMQASSQSLMPDGLEKELHPQDLADLLGFLRQSVAPGGVKEPGK